MGSIKEDRTFSLHLNPISQVQYDGGQSEVSQPLVLFKTTANFIEGAHPVW
jgi:hypothetical protein